jgi:hypothetical protein
MRQDVQPMNSSADAGRHLGVPVRATAGAVVASVTDLTATPLAIPGV